MTALETLRDVARNPGQVAREWKQTGKKVLGYRCLYVPEEVIWAADMLPYPLYGTPDPVGLADSYFQACTCEFVRNIFDHALADDLAFLDGLALSNTCDVIRRLYDMWRAHMPAIPVHMVNNPQKVLSDTNRDYFLTELAHFRTWVEELSGNRVTDEGLTEAIGLHNETRTLLQQLYAKRQGDLPPLTGAEALDVCTAITVLPKDRANVLLKELLGELDGREPEGADPDAPRILVMGSILDHPALVQMVEEEGGLVVAEDLCNTTRYFWRTVEPPDEVDGGPMVALYRFLNQRPHCACMHPIGARLEYLTELVDHYDAEAVINFNLKYCHPCLYDAPLFQTALESRDIPVSVLEVGHDMSGHGQLRTRIQAFIEMVEG